MCIVITNSPQQIAKHYCTIVPYQMHLIQPTQYIIISILILEYIRVLSNNAYVTSFAITTRKILNGQRRVGVRTVNALRGDSDAFDGSNSEYDIEPYVGPIGSMYDMEGGIAIAESALNVIVGPSLVAPGRGLFLSIFDEEEEYDLSEQENMVKEVIIPQGTPICGYARGYFSFEEKGDKSVSYMFNSDTLIFYEKQLMGISDAIQLANNYDGSMGTMMSSEELLWGHNVELDPITGVIQSMSPDPDFNTRIFIPDKADDKNEFAATSIGMFANDLAYDPEITSKEAYLQKSSENNILQLIWRLELNIGTKMLVPTWPVVVAKNDIRLCNSVPMEVGLQYGYEYWNSFKKQIN